jgi:hypothetical protein
MAESSENEVRGLHALGTPEVEYRSSDNGPTGDSPIGSVIWGRVMARGVPSGPRSGMGGVPAGREILRKSKSR